MYLRIRKVREKIKILILAIGILPFLSFEVFHFEGWVYVINITVLLVWMLLYGNRIRRNSNRRYFRLILLYFLVIMLTSLINRNLTWGILYSMFSVYIVSNIVVIEKEIILKALFFDYMVLVFANYFFQCFFGNFIRANYAYAFGLVGGKNGMAGAFLPALVVFMVFFWEGRHRWLNLGLTAFLGYQMYLSGSRTGFLVTMLFALLCAVFHKRLHVWFGACMFIVVELLLCAYADNVFSVQGLRIIGDDGTFNFRTYIWDESIRMIARNPLIAYGRGEKSIVTYTAMVFGETHNMMLQILINGGIVALIIFGYMMLDILRRQGRVSKEQRLNVIHIGLFVYFVAGLTESIGDRTEFWILLSLLYAQLSYSGFSDERTTVNLEGKRSEYAKGYGYDACLQQGAYH